MQRLSTLNTILVSLVYRSWVCTVLCTHKPVLSFFFFCFLLRLLVLSLNHNTSFHVYFLPFFLWFCIIILIVLFFVLLSDVVLKMWTIFWGAYLPKIFKIFFTYDIFHFIPFSSTAFIHFVIFRCLLEFCVVLNVFAGVFFPSLFLLVAFQHNGPKWTEENV